MACQHRSGCHAPALGYLDLAGVRLVLCYDHLRLIAPLTADRLARLIGTL